MPHERTPKPEIEIREMELDDLAPVYHMGEKLFTSDLYPFLYRTWDEWEVVGHYNTDPEFALVAEAAQHIIVMYAGQVVESARATEIFRAPRHPYTQALLRALPEFAQDKARLESLPGVVPGKYDRPQG